MPLFYLLFGLYGLLLLATPFLAIALYVRNSKLRQELNELAEENAKQHTKLQRAIGELQTKLGATSSPSAPTVEKHATPEASQPSVIQVPRSYPHVPSPSPLAVPPQFIPQPPLKTPTPLPIPLTEKKPEAAPEQKPQAPPPSVLVPPVIATPPAVPPATPTEPKPLAPTAQAPLEPKPTPPPAPPKVIAPPTVPHTPVIPPPQPAAIPPTASASVSTPPPFSPLRTSAPRPTMKDRMRAISALEDALWNQLVRQTRRHHGCYRRDHNRLVQAPIFWSSR